MATMPPTFRPSHLPGQREQRQRDDAARRDRLPWRRWYSRAAWRKLAAQVLAEQPLCPMCEAEGRTRAAAVVHHKRPHRGDWALFIDRANLEAVCKAHHDRDLQRDERQAAGGGAG